MSHLSASVANFRLMCETTSGDGGFAWTHARAVFMIDDAVEQDPWLPRWVGGGQRRSMTTDGTLGRAGTSRGDGSLGGWRRRALAGASALSRGTLFDGGRGGKRP